MSEYANPWHGAGEAAKRHHMKKLFQQLQSGTLVVPTQYGGGHQRVEDIGK